MRKGNVTESISAKKYDIHTGKAIVTAQKKCPGLVVLSPDYHLYVRASKALMDKLHYYSDNVTQYSIDEAWAEFSEYRFLYGGIVEFANDPMRKVHNRMLLIFEENQIRNWIMNTERAIQLLQQIPILLKRESQYEQQSLF